MTKTLYISDLDGTLLNSHQQISETTKKILNRLIRERGLNFTVATARTPATVVKILSGIDCRLPYVVMTGAAMWKEEIVNQHYLQPTQVDKLLELCHKAGFNPFVYTHHGKGIETFHSEQRTDLEHRFIAARSGSPYKKFTFTGRMPENAKQRVLLMFTTGDHAGLKAVYEEAKKIVPCTMTCSPDIYNNGVGILEVMAEGASKAAAIRELARETGANRIVVFGDSPNDLSMREVANYFVAPSNAADEVKSVADEVIGSNDEDSVVHWIEHDVESQA